MLRAFGQVDLPPGAVRAGEVVDVNAVAEAMRTWKVEPELSALASGLIAPTPMATISSITGRCVVSLLPSSSANSSCTRASLAVIGPEALAGAVRHTARRVGPSVPMLVTENGIATADDTERVDYTRAALAGLARAIADGVDVRGYQHWSLLDNYEWGSWRPTFGLVSVDRETFARTVKPSARWYGEVARTGVLDVEGSGN